jgi:hypothetical protein
MSIVVGPDEWFHGCKSHFRHSDKVGTDTKRLAYTRVRVIEDIDIECDHVIYHIDAKNHFIGGRTTEYHPKQYHRIKRKSRQLRHWVIR